MNKFYEDANKAWIKGMKDNMEEGDKIYNLEPFYNQEDRENQDEEGGLQGAGIYIMKDGKLVKGEGRKREEVMFSNWYCSNADPEDLRRHRELMDRFSFKGPHWDDIGVPKSIIEEENPVYRKIEKEENPNDREDAEEVRGDKGFDYVVR